MKWILWIGREVVKTTLIVITSWLCAFGVVFFIAKVVAYQQRRNGAHEQKDEFQAT